MIIDFWCEFPIVKFHYIWYNILDLLSHIVVSGRNVPILGRRGLNEDTPGKCVLNEDAEKDRVQNVGRTSRNVSSIPRRGRTVCVRPQTAFGKRSVGSVNLVDSFSDGSQKPCTGDLCSLGGRRLTDGQEFCVISLTCRCPIQA